MRVVCPVFQICFFYTSQTHDSTLDPIKLYYFTKQGFTRFSFFVMICEYRQNFVIKTIFKYRVDHSHFLMPYFADAPKTYFSKFHVRVLFLCNQSRSKFLGFLSGFYGNVSISQSQLRLNHLSRYKDYEDMCKLEYGVTNSHFCFRISLIVFSNVPLLDHKPPR